MKSTTIKNMEDREFSGINCSTRRNEKSTSYHSESNDSRDRRDENPSRKEVKSKCDNCVNIMQQRKLRRCLPINIRP